MPRGETPNHALRRLVAAFSGAIILLVGIGLPVAIIAPVPAAVADVAAARAADTAVAKPVFPSFGAGAIGAVGFDGVFATYGSQRPRTMASVTKVLTALVVLQAKPLQVGQAGPTIAFTQRDVAVLNRVIARNGSWQLVRAGWRTSERAALETMLIPSANNYAESIAIWAFGSVPRYLVAARAYLKAHGLTGTTVVDPNGLSAGDRSTPTDLVALGRLALAHPVVAAITRRATATEPNVGQVANTNKLLGSHGVDGIKTGTFTASSGYGANLLFSATVHVEGRAVRLVGVVLGALGPTGDTAHANLDATVPRLIASVRKGLHTVVVAKRGQAFATYQTRWGDVGRAVAASSRSVLVWGRQAVRSTATVRSITGGRKGERVGAVRATIGGRVVSVTLVLDRRVLAAPIWWRLTHPIR